MTERLRFNSVMFAGAITLTVLMALTLLGGPFALAQAPELGEGVYTTNCSACHQANGQGIPAAFPPLAGHVPELYNLEGGPEFLINVVVHGMQGPITVDGMSYNGVMPAWQQLSDEEIASVINYTMTAWGNEDLLPDNYQLVQPSQVADARAQELSPEQVHEQRTQVVGE